MTSTSYGKHSVLKERFYFPRSMEVALFIFLILALVASPQQSRAQQATIEGNLIQIPVMIYGELGLSLDLRIVPSTNPPKVELVFAEQLAEFNQSSASTFNGSILTIPSLELNGESIWVRLLYLVGSEPISFELFAADIDDYDDDNDLIPDHMDAFPYNIAERRDTDGDGIGDNADSDDDNDGTPDLEDAAPRRGDVATTEPLTAEMVLGTFVQSRYLPQLVNTDMDIHSTATSASARIQLNPDGSAVVDRATGREKWQWLIFDDALAMIPEGPAEPESFLSTGIIEQIAGQVAAVNIQHFVEYEVTTLGQLYRLVKETPKGRVYHVTLYQEYRIVDDEIREILQGSADADPIVYVDSVGQNLFHVDYDPLARDSFDTAEIPGEWALPLGLGKNEDLDLSTPRFAWEDDIAVFTPDGNGLFESDGEQFTWSVDQDGLLNIFTEYATISIELVSRFADGMEVFATAERNDDIHFRHSLAMKREGDMNIDHLFGEYLVKSTLLTSLDGLDDDGRIDINSRTLFGLVYEADGTGSYSQLSGLVPKRWFLRNQAWERINNKIVTNRFKIPYSTCEPEIPRCIDEVREWDILKVVGNRIYVLERRLAESRNEPNLFNRLMGPRQIYFYEAYELTDTELSLEGDYGIPDVNQ
ncbi:MAG: hypothetical protein R3F50_05495 [Gammaproteobacteria bacterium]